MELGQKVYESAQQAQSQANSGASSSSSSESESKKPNDDGTVDADFEEVK